MRIVIAGAGEMGSHLAKMLSGNGHDITIVDKDPKALDVVGSLADSIDPAAMASLLGVTRADIMADPQRLFTAENLFAFIGKPLGIFTASWIAVKSKLAVMPEGASWRMLWAVACLGGIGFTMSIFVDTLAFSHPEMIDRGKIAILMGSTAAGILGSTLILLFSKSKKERRYEA